MPKTPLNSQKLAESLRARSINLQDRTFRMTQFVGSDQATDLSLPPNCAGFGRVHRFRLTPDPAWMPNPLPIAPVAKYHGLPMTDVLHAQVFQTASCDFRCWYCFVDYSLLSANDSHSQFVTAQQLFQLLVADNAGARVIDLSGGQPELIPEHVLWMLQERDDLGLTPDYFVWADDNLSTDFMWRFLSDSEIAYMTSVRGFARVGCLKGYDPESFAFNTSASPDLFDNQIGILARLVQAGFDQYAYITLTSLCTDDVDSKISKLMDMIQERVHPNFPLRVVPLRIFPFNANHKRFNATAERNQFRTLEAWQKELQRRFDSNSLDTPITEVNLKR